MVDLSSFVADWGGFEELVKKLHGTGSVSVERNVKRIGLSGAERQIDVLITHRQGLYNHEVVAECKYWNKRVSRLHVDALATTIKEIGASRGAIFSTKGFQDGAVKQATHEKIDLFTVRELTDHEWGMPGRHIDFWLQVITMGVSHPIVENPTSFLGYEPANNEVILNLGKDERSSTPINLTTRKERTLEDLIQNSCVESVSSMQMPGLFKDKNGNSNGIARAVTGFELNFKKPLVTLHAGGIVVIPKITFALGIAVSQTRMQFDRAANSIFALAVENVVSRTVYGASQYRGEEFASIYPLRVREDNLTKNALMNGSVFSVQTSVLGAFDEFRDCTPGVFTFETEQAR